MFHMDKDQVRKLTEYSMKYYPHMMIGMFMAVEQTREYDLRRLACLSAMCEHNEKLLRKYSIKLELRKPFLQKTYELFGKAV